MINQSEPTPVLMNGWNIWHALMKQAKDTFQFDKFHLITIWDVEVCRMQHCKDLFHPIMYVNIINLINI